MEQIRDIFYLAEEISQNTDFEVSINLETHIKALDVYIMSKGKYRRYEQISGGNIVPFTYYAGTGYSPEAIKNGLNRVVKRLQKFLEENRYGTTNR